MITDKGQIKIMDFGLAKVLGGPQMTKLGTILGTAAYMSPEQAQGMETDHRTDIWAFGVVLYEMLTGKMPFPGDYEQAVIYAILNEEPHELSDDVPEALQHIVFRCLEKKTVNRYKSAAQLLAELQKLKKEIDSGSSHSVLSTAVEAKKSIVVLPFDDLSPNKDNEYFSDGLSEEIISDLSQVHTLRVISRNSAMMLKGTKKGLNEIGLDLNVQYALMGGVRKAGNKLRITVQLLDCQTDTNLWAEKYKGTVEDIFEIQEQVSRSIVDALKVKLTLSEEKKMADRPIQNATAYECYLKARQDIFLFTEDSLDRACQSLENGLKIVGKNELLYSGLGYVYFQYVNIGIKPDLLPKAEEMANKIFELEPDSHYGYKLLGLINYKRGNFQASAKYFKKTLDIEPNDVDAIYWLAPIHIISGKMTGAANFAKRLIEVDPLTPVNYCFPMYAHLYSNDFDTAYHIGRKMYEMDPENTVIKLFFSDTLIWNNKYEEAQSILQPLTNYKEPDPLVFLGIFLYAALQSRKSEALASVTQEVIQFSSNDEHFPLLLAGGYMLIGEYQKAMDWLEVLINRGFVNYPVLNEYHPLLENLRSEPRFKQLMERVKHEWENFEI